LQAAKSGENTLLNVPRISTVEGNFETSYLLEQVGSVCLTLSRFADRYYPQIDVLRGTVRFLRTENSYLKGQDLLREIDSLPPLPGTAARRPATPPLEQSTVSDSDGDTDQDDARLATPPPRISLRALATETKCLYRDVIQFSSSPRIVDLSVVNAKRAEAKNGKVWMPKEDTGTPSVAAKGRGRTAE
jgi:dynactin 1